MITNVDLAPLPHIRLVLTVPVPLPAGGWTWGTRDDLPSELAREYGYSNDEVCSLVHTYGRMVPVVVPIRALGDRFRVTAWGLATGLPVGIREWSWSAESREYVPVGEYLSSWREAMRVFYRRTGEFFEERTFKATSGYPMGCDPSKRPALMVALDAIPAQRMAEGLPHVRHREDVPHEHALPNLYGLATGA